MRAPTGVRTPSTACGGSPPSKREVLGFRRSKPAALPSIGYRGFAVAPMTLRASSRSHCYYNRYGCSRYATGAQCSFLMGVMAVQPSVADAFNRCNDAAQHRKRISPLRFLPRCRGAQRAPVDIPQTLDFPVPMPPSSSGGDRSAGAGRSSFSAGAGRRKKPRREGFFSRRGFFYALRD